MTTSDERRGGTGGYRRRRRLPAVVFLLVLAVVVGVVWRQVLGSEATTTAAAACPAPPVPTAAADPAAPAPVAVGTTVDRAVLAATAPAAPRDTSVRVLNANGQRGQAGVVSAELVTSLGFVPAADAPTGNDTVYADQNMQCVGQIRFGAAGLAQARTLALVVPCAELVQDARADAVVDLALGTAFGNVTPSAATQAVLTALSTSTPEAPVAVDQASLDEASDASC